MTFGGKCVRLVAHVGGTEALSGSVCRDRGSQGFGLFFLGVILGRVNDVFMRHFDQSEFKHPDKMDKTFLLFLDEVRERCGFPFVLTSDARTLEENSAASGSSPTSLHLLGRAVDFRIPDFVAGKKPWVEFATLSKAIPAARDSMPTKYAYELELVYSDKDHHVHLGLFPDDRADRLVVASD